MIYNSQRFIPQSLALTHEAAAKLGIFMPDFAPWTGAHIGAKTTVLFENPLWKGHIGSMRRPVEFTSLVA
jgi:hypothetical protein